MTIFMHLITKLGAIGNVSTNTAAERIHRSFLIYMSILMSFGGLTWGGLASYFDLFWPSLIPYGYVGFTIVNLTYFAFSKRFRFFHSLQVSMSISLPFIFQLSIGGFSASGAVMLWSLVPLVAIMTFSTKKSNIRWLIIYILGTLATGLLDFWVRPDQAEMLPDVSTLLFLLNIIMVSGIVCGLVIFLLIQRDKIDEILNEKNAALFEANDELIQLKSNLEDLVEERTLEVQNALAHLNGIIHNISDSILVADNEGKVELLNEAFCSMFHIEDDIRGEDLEMAFSSDLVELIKNPKSDSEAFSGVGSEISLPGQRIGKAVVNSIEIQGAGDSQQMTKGSVTVIRDITFEKEVDRMKTDFIASVSHELRTPLTSILGFTRIIEKKLVDVIFPLVPTEERKVKRALKQVNSNLKIIGSEGGRLTQLINDVLDVAKMESGKIEWKQESLSMGEVVQTAVKSTRSLFEESEVKLKVDVAEDLPHILGDSARLIQVMINLISNAIKFTDKGSVTCRVAFQEPQIMIQVIDTGIGIAEDNLESVFERFKQVGDTLTEKPMGTGLGLPICKHIVEHHGGEIWVESELGIGSVFTFTLSALESDSFLHSAQAKSIDSTSLIKHLNDLIGHDSVTHPTIDKQSKTILVVDDDPMIRELLRQELEADGYAVCECADGMEALNLVKREKPDLIILDIMMPKINGFDVAAILKNDPNTMKIPIIIHSIVEDRERGGRIGVDRYFKKSKDTREILKEVEELLAQEDSHKKVMVVDEDETTIHDLLEVLKARGYAVTGLSTGEDCLETAKTVKPDVIIADVLYPGCTNMLQTLRLENEMENVLIVVLGENKENDGSLQS